MVLVHDLMMMFFIFYVSSRNSLVCVVLRSNRFFVSRPVEDCGSCLRLWVLESVFKARMAYGHLRMGCLENCR